ncbi:MAG: polyprenyl diphosphate synthase [Actinobacteria bacterium]|nr:polyprenyl diphosphate synthase [Actinomycetota bacterium]MCL6095056.1 polyprenyl diphosphate synthase [Actinomycetota bacterium]
MGSCSSSPRVLEEQLDDRPSPEGGGLRSSSCGFTTSLPWAFEDGCGTNGAGCGFTASLPWVSGWPRLLLELVWRTDCWLDSRVRARGIPVSLADIDRSRVPVHIACVMDGNGRWANIRGLPRTEGHAAGEAALLDAVEGALEIGVKWLTMFAFSTENWRRPVDEVRYLMNFNEGLLLRRRDELHEKGVRIRFSGRRDWRVPKRVIRRMDESAALTASNKRMTLTMAFNYGGRAEIVDAVKSIVADRVPIDKVDERTIRSRLYYPDMPDPDLVIRTSGEYRISNFLLWELAYSELVFMDVLWPDFRRSHLYEAVAEYQRRERRFGGVRQQ